MDSKVNELLIKKFLSKEEIELQSIYFKKTKFVKGEILIESGQICSKFYFIKEGLIRIYTNEDNGKQKTVFFAKENEFVSAYSSFLTGLPSKESLDAIENCVIYEISKEDLEELTLKIPKIQKIRQIIAEQIFIEMEKRVLSFYTYTAQQKYEVLLNEDPDLILRVPQNYIASYIGVTTQHLSRIRKNI